jgi:hypothetical protein
MFHAITFSLIISSPPLLRHYCHDERAMPLMMPPPCRHLAPCHAMLMPLFRYAALLRFIIIYLPLRIMTMPLRLHFVTPATSCHAASCAAIRLPLLPAAIHYAIRFRFAITPPRHISLFHFHAIDAMPDAPPLMPAADAPFSLLRH